MIVCHGPCSVKFENCRLEASPIVASGGANVTLSNTNIACASCGVLIQGTGSQLALNLGTFSQVHQVMILRLLTERTELLHTVVSLDLQARVQTHQRVFASLNLKIPQTTRQHPDTHSNHSVPLYPYCRSPSRSRTPAHSSAVSIVAVPRHLTILPICCNV